MQKLDARFIIGASSPDLFPREELPEIAFLGRSNVGKSTLLNAVAGQKGLAHTSSTPGRTQSINFFRIGDRCYLVDLPGYGYAKVPGEVSRPWKRLIETYLESRKSLALCFVLLDARRGWMPQDLELTEWLESRNRRFQLIATKFDKLKSQKERNAALARLAEYKAETDPILFSALTGQGVRELWQTIWKTSNPPTKPPAQ